MAIEVAPMVSLPHYRARAFNSYSDAHLLTAGPGDVLDKSRWNWPLPQQYQSGSGNAAATLRKYGQLIFSGDHSLGNELWKTAQLPQ